MYSLADTYKDRDEVHDQIAYVNKNWENLHPHHIVKNFEGLSDVEVFGEKFDLSLVPYTKDIMLLDLNSALSNLYNALLDFKYIEVDTSHEVAWLLGRQDIAKHIAKVMIEKLTPIVKEYAQALYEIDIKLEEETE